MLHLLGITSGGEAIFHIIYWQCKKPSNASANGSDTLQVVANLWRDSREGCVATALGRQHIGVEVSVSKCYPIDISNHLSSYSYGFPWEEIIGCELVPSLVSPVYSL